MSVNMEHIRYHLDHIRSALLHLEVEATGHCLTGNAAEIRELATRLENLCRPDKGHLPKGVEAREMKDAA